MARPKRVHCKRCNRHVDVCGRLSSRYLCHDCGVGRAIDNADQLHQMSGEAVDRWRRGVAASVGAVIPDRGTSS